MRLDMDMKQVVIFLILLASIAPYFVVRYARNKKPNNYTTAMILCIMFPHSGHFYIGKPGLWFTCIVCAFATTIPFINIYLIWPAALILSTLLMHFRFKRMAREKADHAVQNTILP